VDETGIEPTTPCLQSSEAKPLIALLSVAYTETSEFPLARMSRSWTEPISLWEIPLLHVERQNQ